MVFARLVVCGPCGKPQRDRDGCCGAPIDTRTGAGDGQSIMRALLPIPLILMLAACGGESAQPVAAISQPEARLPHRARGGAFGGVIGADADALIRQFGPPRLDIHDGDARKLQWSGTACILDAYLYPGAHGEHATATFIDARRGDGRDVDREACIAALRKN